MSLVLVGRKELRKEGRKLEVEVVEVVDAVDAV